MLKEKYDSPQLEVLVFSTRDVISTSETPYEGWNPNDHYEEYEGWNPNNPGDTGGDVYEGWMP